MIHVEGRFVCDRMLGRLARWLRMMGVDTEYPGEMDDRELVDMSIKSGRILLTRDRDLAARMGSNAAYIQEHELEDQIERFIDGFGMPEGWFQRCTTCNGVLSVDETLSASGRVPEAILHGHIRIWTCRRCGQAYWPGTQFDDIEARLKEFADRVEAA